MNTSTNLNDLNENKNMWQAIRYRMNERKIAPYELAKRTGYSINLIIKGTKGEAALLTEEFVRNCISVFQLTNSRTDDGSGGILSLDECLGLLKPKPAMPSGDGNFWD